MTDKKEVTIIVDGVSIKAVKGETVAAAAQRAGIFVPSLSADLRLPRDRPTRVTFDIPDPVGIAEFPGGLLLPASSVLVETDGLVVKFASPAARAKQQAALSTILQSHFGDCYPPCQMACPCHVPGADFIKMTLEGRMGEALMQVIERNPFTLVCGTVCPRFCEDACRRNVIDQPVNINDIKRFLYMYNRAHQGIKIACDPPTGKTVAIVGAGPAGLACAHFLARKGHKCTVYEALPNPGGMLRYGIPAYRLPKDELDEEIKFICQDIGVDIQCNKRMGRDFTLADLQRDNDAVYVAIGSQLPTMLRFPGSDSKGVIGGVDFLRDVALGQRPSIGQKVLVIGGGNVSIDVARTCLRLGIKDVTLTCVLRKEDMPAHPLEIKEALAEGVKLDILAQPMRISPQPDGKLAIEYRKRPNTADIFDFTISIPGSEYTYIVDTIILAIGQRLDTKICQDNGIPLNARGNAIAAANDKTYISTMPNGGAIGRCVGVFVGGDAVLTPMTVVHCVSSARKAARAMHQLLSGKKLEDLPDEFDELKYFHSRGTLQQLLDTQKAVTQGPKRVPYFNGVPLSARNQTVETMHAHEAAQTFKPITAPFTEAMARTEAARCLQCGCGNPRTCHLRKVAENIGLESRAIVPLTPVHLHTDNPFFNRDLDKCVHCTRCIRACAETRVIGAIEDPFTMTWKSVDMSNRRGAIVDPFVCESCGTCLDVCPTNALFPKRKEVSPDTVVRSCCSYCGCGCGLLIHVRNGKPVAVKGDPTTPSNHGQLCVKGRFGLLDYNMCSERLTTPLIRKDGRFVPATWEEAMSLIAAKFTEIKQKYGPDALQAFASAKTVNEENYLMMKIFRSIIGTNNVDHCLAEDHQVLTNEGFKFLSDLQQPGVWDRILIAAYDPASDRIVYQRPIGSIILHARQQQQMVEISEPSEHFRLESDDPYDLPHATDSVSNHVSVLVTPGHQVYVHPGRVSTNAHNYCITMARGQDGLQFRKMKAEDLSTATNVAYRLCARAANGLFVDKPHPLPSFTSSMTLKQKQLFFELFGFFLGDGSVDKDPSGRARAVVFGNCNPSDNAFLKRTLEELNWRYKIKRQDGNGQRTRTAITEVEFVTYIASEFAHHYQIPVDPNLESSSSRLHAKGKVAKSAKWFPNWFWTLPKEEMRIVLRGLRRADGEEAVGQSHFFTSSVIFRDEIVHAGLLAGYSAMFKLEYKAGTNRGTVESPIVATQDCWRVMLNEKCITMLAGRDVKKTVKYEGQTWCVEVPTGHIITRRAVLGTVDGVSAITKASRPVVVGNCARLCHSSTVAGLAVSFGSGAMTNSADELEFAKCILITGSNTTETHPIIALRIKAAAKRGCKIIIADPRRINLCAYACMHLKQRSGTDVYLFNAMMNVILQEKLHKPDFIANFTENFEAFAAEVVKYTPEQAEHVTGVPADDIRKAARLYATSETSSIIFSMGITQHSTGVDNVLTLANLAMLCGQIGRPSTGVNPLRGQNNVQGACDMGALPNVFSGYQKVVEPAVRAKFEKAWGMTTPLPDKVGFTVTQAINQALAGKIKAIYIMGENPLMSDPNLHHAEEALDKLEFLVVQDIVMTETARHATVVLPAASLFEKTGTFTNTERRVLRVNQLMAPPGQARQDWEILVDFANRMGGHLSYPRGNLDILDEINAVTPSYGGITNERLTDGMLQWPCPNKDHPGTVYLHKDGKFTRGKGLFSAVAFREPAELPDAEYPLVMTTGRVLYQYHTGTMSRKCPGLNEIAPTTHVEVNATDAAKLGIVDQERVYVVTRRGRIVATALVPSRVREGVVFLPFHYCEAPVNQLTNDALDPVAAIPEFKACACRIEKIAPGSEPAPVAHH